MHLDAEVASVDIITQEEISCVGWAATDFEQLHKIILCKVHQQVTE